MGWLLRGGNWGVFGATWELDCLACAIVTSVPKKTVARDKHASDAVQKVEVDAPRGPTEVLTLVF